jgi:hypothetical protein
MAYLSLDKLLDGQIKPVSIIGVLNLLPFSYILEKL